MTRTPDDPNVITSTVLCRSGACDEFVDDGIVEFAGPPDEADLQPPHRRAEPIRREVAKAQEIPRQSSAVERSFSCEPAELVVDHVDEDEVRRDTGDHAHCLGIGELEIAEDTLDEVAHHRLAVVGEPDVDGACGAGLDQVWRVLDGVAVEERLEQFSAACSHPADHLAAHTALGPVVRHVQRAATGEDVTLLDIAVDAQRPDQTRLDGVRRIVSDGGPVVHRSTRGSLRTSPSSTNRS